LNPDLPNDARVRLRYSHEGQDFGHALETAVLLELERRGAEVGYLKTPDGLEIDFLARHPSAGEEVIQVCTDLADEGTRTRELRALSAIAGEHPRAKRRLLVIDRDGLSGSDADGVQLQPVYEWLLAPLA
jgi:predicted AAA+ superfamily ATPase